MEKISKDYIILIEQELYREVMVCIESHYDYNKSEQLSQVEGKEMIVLKNKSELSKRVVEIIKKFAEEKKLDINLVKENLLNMIEREIEKKAEEKDKDDWEEIEAKGIINLNEEELEK